MSLFAGSKAQRGMLGTNCWSYTDANGYGTGYCADAVWGWPPAKEVMRGKRARILIRFAERPRELDLDAYRRLGDYQQPTGHRSRVAYSMRPVLRDGTRVGWTAVFRYRLPHSKGPWYLSVFARWTQGDAEYTFHLKLV